MNFDLLAYCEKNVSLLNLSSLMVFFLVKHNDCQHLCSRLDIPSYLYSYFLECMGMCQTETLRLNAWYSALSISNNIFYPNYSVKGLLGYLLSVYELNKVLAFFLWYCLQCPVLFNPETMKVHIIDIVSLFENQTELSHYSFVHHGLIFQQYWPQTNRRWPQPSQQSVPQVIWKW